MIYKSYFLAFIFSICLMSSCGERPLISIDHAVPQDWTYDDILSYQLDIKDPAATYDLVLTLDYMSSFGYQNLYVKITTAYPDDKTVSDVVSLNLTDGAGTFLGKCNSQLCSTDILLQESFKFRKKGIHVISIAQYSRQENLEGIKNASLQLYKRKMT